MKRSTRVLATKTPAIVLLTRESLAEVEQRGGSAAWVLAEAQAKERGYALLTRNGRKGGWVSPDHGRGFAVLAIDAIVRAPSEPSRWMVKATGIAMVDVQAAWQLADGKRNPVRYAMLEDAGIDPSTLEFRPLAASRAGAEDRGAANESQAAEGTRELASSRGGIDRGLTIAEAKRGLARMFGVSEDAVEITIHG